MSEEPKKPARKKPAPKSEAPGADAQPKSPTRSDEEMREAVLAASLPHAAFDGFSDSLLQKAGAEAGVTKADVARLFENGPVSLMEFYSGWADGEMEKRLAAADLKAMKIRERTASRVFTAMAMRSRIFMALRSAAASRFSISPSAQPE